VKLHFFVKLTPHRATFAQDMTADERAVMQEHVAHWTGQMHKGNVIVFGPVLNPAGSYGVGVVAVDEEQQVRSLVDSDPAKRFMQIDYWPMRAVYPGVTA
jgi:uncharacterized protein YciI